MRTQVLEEEHLRIPHKQSPTQGQESGLERALLLTFQKSSITCISFSFDSQASKYSIGVSMQ